jgi:signal peptidase I
VVAIVMARVAFHFSAIGLAAAFALFWLGLALRNEVIAVKGVSMEPMLQPGQLIVLNRSVYHNTDGGGPHRGDVVVFRHMEPGYDEYLVKRVIGLPGEFVRVVAGQVFINDTPLDEPYVRAADDYSYPLEGGPTRVPEGAYFVLGDNRPESADSHLGWFVRATDLLGQAWPLPMVLP